LAGPYGLPGKKTTSMLGFMKAKNKYHHGAKASSKVQHRFPPISWASLQKLAAKQMGRKLGFEVTEGANFFELGIHIPGCRRNDINILIKGRMLHIEVRYTPGSEEHLDDLRSILNRPILLPENLDPDFISAEYKNGTLTIYFFKTLCPCENIVEEIFVY